MKVLILPDGTEKKIISETDRYFITEDAQFKKMNWANCTEEIPEEEPEKEMKAEPKPKAKKSAKKSEKKED